MDNMIKLVAARAGTCGLVLLLSRDKARAAKTALIAHLLFTGPIFVVSGDEWLPSFALAQAIRARTVQVKPILDRLHCVRASTCHRLLDSLAAIPPKGEPLLVLDFLHTFHDTDIPLRTRLFRLRECCRELKRLAIHRPVLVMIQERESEDSEKLLPALYSIADKVFTLAPEQESIQQPALF